MTEVENEYTDVMEGPLDLSDADTSGFDPIPAGTYKMRIESITPVKVKNEGAYPKGWPQENVQFAVTDDSEEYANRRCFNRYTGVLPEGYDPSKAAKIKGMFVNFLKAAGVPEEDIMSGDYHYDRDALVGAELYVTVKVQPGDPEKGYDPQNRVTGVKSLAEGAATATAGSGLL